MKDDAMKGLPERAFFSKAKVPYAKTKEEVWQAMEQKLTVPSSETSKKPAKVISFSFRKMAVAASIAILIGTGLFLRFYTVSITSTVGTQMSHTLPDGSTVQLNAASSLSYAPYWWGFQRSVTFEGEGFFEVQKGSTFSVVSNSGTTQVLGTSFNIHAREGIYEVYCATGKVRVSDTRSNQVVLTPGQLAYVSADKLLKESPGVPQEAVILSWRIGKFIYNTTPLSKVLKDLERHYGVRVRSEIGAPKNYHYTGLFDRSVSVEEALDIICYSYGFSFDKEALNTFVVRKK